jgi:UDP-N-acetylglucosamine 2-epimerase (non-hydrolysing)
LDQKYNQSTERFKQPEDTKSANFSNAKLKRKIAVFTGTRADYGLLKGLMYKIKKKPNLELQIIAAAGHFSSQLGNTWHEIISDGFIIDSKIDMLMASDTNSSISRSVGVGIITITDALERLSPDILVILGDRFEALVAAQVALILNIPIAHIHGGEITEGAIDDAIRHAITKMSYLHFVSTDIYANRVRQMGAPSERIFNVGAPSLDNIHERSNPKDKIFKLFNFSLNQPYFISTYHPATASDEDPIKSAKAMIDAMNDIEGHQIILTYANADQGGQKINKLLIKYSEKYPKKILTVPNLGFDLYRDALAHSAAIVGNSSSGIIEAPPLGITTINIGIRQKGRLMAKSIINVMPNQQEISKGLKLALSEEGKANTANAKSLYGVGDSSTKMLEILNNHPLDYNLPFCDILIEEE